MLKLLPAQNIILLREGRGCLYKWSLDIFVWLSRFCHFPKFQWLYTKRVLQWKETPNKCLITQQTYNWSYCLLLLLNIQRKVKVGLSFTPQFICTHVHIFGTNWEFSWRAFAPKSKHATNTHERQKKYTHVRNILRPSPGAPEMVE